MTRFRPGRSVGLHGRLPVMLLAVIVTWLVAITGAGDSVAQQPYPQQPIRLVVSFQSATTMDSVARMIATKLGEGLGQTVIVDNRPGASGLIAEEIVAKAVPDGHTLLVAGLALATLPSIYGARAVDPISAFVPIAWLTSQPVAIIVNPVLHIDSLAELIAEARRRPGQLAFSTNGVGGPAHLAAATLWSRADVDLVVIPYNSAGSLKDLLSGEVPLTVGYLTGMAPFLRAHQLKALAVTGGTRMAAFPDIPTVAEQGFPGFEVASWFGLLAPAGTPKSIVDRINAAVVRILDLPEVREKLTAVGIEPVGGAPEEFGEKLKSEIVRWRPIVKKMGLQQE